MIALLLVTRLALLFAANQPLDLNDPDAIGDRLRQADCRWSTNATDPYELATAYGAAATVPASETAQFKNRFLTESGGLVVQGDGNRPVAIVESGKSVILAGEAVSGRFRPERRNAALDLLASIPSLPPIFAASQAEFQKRIRTITASVPPGCTLILRWIRPVIGLTSLKAGAEMAPGESEIGRFSQIWLRTVYGLRLSATWETPYGRFRQESRVYPRDPIQVIPEVRGVRISPKELSLTLQQNGQTAELPKSGDFPAAIQHDRPFDLTVYENGHVVWLAETSELKQVTVGEKLPGTDPIPVRIELPVTDATEISVGMMVDGRPLRRQFAGSRELVFTIPAGAGRSIAWIRSGNAEIQLKAPIWVLVPVNFA